MVICQRRQNSRTATGSRAALATTSDMHFTARISSFARCAPSYPRAVPAGAADRGCGSTTHPKADLAERNVVLLARNQDEFWRLLQEKTADRTNWQNIVKWRR